jgi:hypothetical protein
LGDIHLFEARKINRGTTPIVVRFFALIIKVFAIVAWLSSGFAGWTVSLLGTLTRLADLAATTGTLLGLGFGLGRFFALRSVYSYVFGFGSSGFFDVVVRSVLVQVLSAVLHGFLFG